MARKTVSKKRPVELYGHKAQKAHHNPPVGFGYASRGNLDSVEQAPKTVGRDINENRTKLTPELLT